MSDKNILFLMMDMPIVRKGQMALDKNPFLDPGYFEHRAKKHRLDRKKAICSNRAAQIGYYALQMRERNAVKAARSVLWGGLGCKVNPLPDTEDSV